MKWRVNFNIPNLNFNLICYSPSAFISFIPKKDDKQLFREWYMEYSDGTCTAYIPTGVIDKVSEWIKEKMVAEPNWADDLHKEAEKMNWEYINFARTITDKDPKKLTNSELLELFKELRRLQLVSHCHAISTTWFVDSNGETFSNYLRARLNKYLAEMGIVDVVKQVEYFILLTSPTKETMTQEEQIDFLNLLQAINNGGNRDELIHAHYKKWRWMPYGYIGPAYELSYYQNLVDESLDKIKDTGALIAEEKNRHVKTKAEQGNLISKINLPADLGHLFAIARDIIWLKDFRKNAMFHGHYVLDMLTKEIARRLNLTHKQANHFLTAEVEEALLHGKYDENVLNDRIKYCVIWADEKNARYFYGKEAREKMKSIEVEEVVLDSSGKFTGTTACPGIVQGPVKIILSVEDIDKVKNGDVLVAKTTYPSYLPAMKRASAIVTEDGGITCHAAIVAREFKIPCVVGVKKVTDTLKDGEMIEVDANTGYIKKI